MPRCRARSAIRRQVNVFLREGGETERVVHARDDDDDDKSMSNNEDVVNGAHYPPILYSTTIRYSLQGLMSRRVHSPLLARFAWPGRRQVPCRTAGMCASLIFRLLSLIPSLSRSCSHSLALPCMHGLRISAFSHEGMRRGEAGRAHSNSGSQLKLSCERSPFLSGVGVGGWREKWRER